MDSLELTQITVLHRHGARSPILSSKEFATQLGVSFSTCSLDIFNGDFLPHLHIHNSLQQSLELNKQLQDVKENSCFYGQLTKTGKDSLQALGRYIREKYILDKKFLPFSYDSSDVQLVSTNYVRTIESLQYLLNGLYPKHHRTHGSSWKVNIKPSICETMSANYGLFFRF